MEWSDLDWGNLPSWGAFLAASIAVTLAAGAYKREGQRDQLKQRLAIQEQASKVGAWIARVVEGRAVEARLLNRSDLPVTNMEVWVEAKLKPGLTGRTGPPIISNLGHTIPVLEPKDDKTATMNLPAGTTEESYDFRVTSTFTDALGIKWRRTPDSLEPDGENQPSWHRQMAELNARVWRSVRHRRL
ncbi:hypothetical protein [Kineococcus xinjiangensis]|uniref:hypothetical protein n=1 Tax=Kineococcus xinjiangensis TaxID=512762 RepID=UPI0011B0AEBA|nr:hypothetical protein [Kineococcus xinjiangensis]